MEKRYNFRIYPNKAQEVQIQKNFGCVRFVYNYYLGKRIEAHKNGQPLLHNYEYCRDLTKLKKTEGYEWLNDADASSLRIAVTQLDAAYARFFSNIKKKGIAPGFPRFKSKKDTRQSYCSHSSGTRRYVSSRTGEVCEYEQSVALREKHIKLPKLGLVRCRVSKEVEGRVLSATVMRVPSGKYYVSVLFSDCETSALPQSGEVIGLHLGVNTLVTKSDGGIIENHRYFERSRKRVAKLQTELSRKTSGGANFEKARLRLARAYERIKNQKTDTMHKLTTRLVRAYDVICVRDCDLTKNMQSPIFSKAYADAGWGELLNCLSYKCRWYGRRFVKVDRFFPSVQICSSCGHKRLTAGKTSRAKTWDCSSCGESHERGTNAARNVLAEGIRFMAASNGEQSSSDYIRPGGPESTPVESGQAAQAVRSLKQEPFSGTPMAV